MKGLEKRKLILKKFSDLVVFYNSSAEEFYRGAFVVIDGNDFSNKFKSDLLYFMVEFERVIKATFHSDIDLQNIELKKFKQMFPNLCNGIFEINNNDDVRMLGKILKVFRNINAHSLSSMSDYTIFKKDYSGLKTQPALIKYIKYLTDNGELTVAGMVFIIMNLGRSQSIKSLTSKDEKFGLLSKGFYTKDDGIDFVNNISHVDWEIKIRDDNKKAIPSAIFGDFLKKATSKQRGYYELQLGSDDNFDVSLGVKIQNNTIVVGAHSLTNVFYPQEYSLKIIDKKHFIELANQFPMFVFVDLLYKLNIKQFDKKAYEGLMQEKNWQFYSKLMYPKFYSDKNIDILFADKKVADLRLNSSVCNGALLAIFMKLEKLIIKNYNIDLRTISYSRIGELLKKIGAPESLTFRIQTLRNLVSHGYILGEYAINQGLFIKHDLPSVINQLCDLLDYFESNNKTIHRCLCNDVSLLFINQLLSVKTKLYSSESIKFIDEYPHSTNIDELKKKALFYDNSSYSVDIFEKLNKKVFGDYRCIKINLKGLDVDLLLVNNETGNQKLTELLIKTKFKIAKENNDGVFRYLTLR